MKKGPITPKGFRDILPDAAKKRRRIINLISDVLEEFGFIPLETPTVEYEETLTGKYGEDEKLIYKFNDRGGRLLALRYDLTVPLARFIANNLNVLTPTFSRYQIGQVFRGENPQKGRYRESTQFDFDTVGSESAEEDAKIIAATIKAARKIGLRDAIMLVNDRKNFLNIPAEVIRAIDKIDKIGKSEAKKELSQKGLSSDKIALIDSIQTKKPTDNLVKIFKILDTKYKLVINKDYKFTPYLARGLDYYTSTIFELKPTDQGAELSIGGGGRYDNLIGIFAGRQIPAVGFSFGIDRITELI